MLICVVLTRELQVGIVQTAWAAFKGVFDGRIGFKPHPEFQPVVVHASDDGTLSLEPRFPLVWEPSNPSGR